MTTLDIRHARIQQARDKVMAWSDGDVIYRPEFAALKDTLSRGYEDDGRQGRPDLPRDAAGHPRSSFYYDLIFRIPPLITLPKSKVPAALAKNRPQAEEVTLHEWWMAYFERWRPVGEKLAQMKEKAISGRRPSAEQVERDRLRALPANQAGRELIATRIIEVTRDWRKAEIERVANYFSSLLQQFIAGKLPDETPSAFWTRELKCTDKDRPKEPYSRAHEAHDRFSQRCEQAHDYARKTEACLKDPDYPRKAGEEHADAIIQNFTAKMQEKLAFAVADLASLVSHHVQRAEQTLNCTLAVTLTSGVRFNVRNSIVGVWSPTGSQFYRFPSTFHDIELPGHEGSIAMASEEEMNALFAPGTTILPADAEKASALAKQAKGRLK